MILAKLSSISIYIIYTFRFWIVFLGALLLLSPLYLFRQVLKQLAKILHPDWVGILDPTDANVYEHLYENPSEKSPPNKGVRVSSCFSLRINFTMDGHFDLADFIHKFQSSIFSLEDSAGNLVYEKLTFYCETWWGFPFWKRDAQFKMENHIRFTEEFQERDASLEEMEIFMGDYISSPFPSKISPWEILVFKRRLSSNETGENGDRDAFAIYCRFHHVLMDGFSMVKLFSHFNDEPNIEPIISPHLEGNWSTKFSLFAKFVWYFGYDIVNMLHTYDENLWKVGGAALTTKVHMISTQEVDFQFAREASRRNGVSTTAVLFSAIAGGIHQFLTNSKNSAQRKSGNVGGDEPTVTVLPDVMRLAAALPVPNHPLQGLVNHWTYAIIALPIREPDSLKRILKIEENLKSVKKSALPLSLWYISPLYTHLPHFLCSLVKNRMSTMTCTNFRGPIKKPKYFDVYEAESTQGHLPRMKGDTAIGIAIVTYQQKITFTLAIDKGLMEDRGSVKELGECMVQEIKRMASLSSD